MGTQTWSDALITSQTDGAALTGSTTATSLLPTGAKYQIPANFWYIGKMVRINAYGRVSNIVTTPGTLTLDVRVGGVIVQTSQALALNVVAKTNVSFRYQMVLTCRSIGSGTATTLMGEGFFTSESVIGSPLPSVGGSGTLMIPASAPAVGTGFDSTVSGTLDFFGTWSLSNANSIQVHQYVPEELN
jgi:hypothetical protein